VIDVKNVQELWKSGFLIHRRKVNLGHDQKSPHSKFMKKSGQNINILF